MEVPFDPSLPPKHREYLEKHYQHLLTPMLCAEVANTSVRFGVSNNAIIRMAMEEYRCKLQDEGMIDYFRQFHDRQS